MKTVEKTSNGITIKVTENDEYGWDVSINGYGTPLMGSYTDKNKMMDDLLPYIALMGVEFDI